MFPCLHGASVPALVELGVLMSQQAAVGSVTAVWLLQWLGYNSGEVATVVRLRQCSWVGGVKVMVMQCLG